MSSGEWNVWEGGDCPVDKGTLVDVEHMSGNLFYGAEAGTLGQPAESWKRYDARSDIIAWRLSEDNAKASGNTKVSNPKDMIGDTKVPLWLLSGVAKAEWALAQFAGMLKYAAWNWRVAGVRSSVYLSAMQRHMDAYMAGEEHDPVDGSHHLGNIMACAAILLDAKAAGKLTDDRPPKLDVRGTYSRVQEQMAVLKEKYKDVKVEHFTIENT